MVLDNLKKVMYQELGALFSGAVVDEMADDMTAYRKKLYIIAKIAEILSINTDIITVSIDIKTNEGGREDEKL